MSRLAVCLLFVSFVAFALTLSGCLRPAESPPSEPPESHAAPAAAPAEHAQGEQAGHEGQGPYADALAKLSEADRALAEKQKVCPVSGQPLGSMGTPYKVTVKGRDVLLCCQGCEAEIQKDPDKYLAKLPK